MSRHIRSSNLSPVKAVESDMDELTKALLGSPVIALSALVGGAFGPLIAYKFSRKLKQEEFQNARQMELDKLVYQDAYRAIRDLSSSVSGAMFSARNLAEIATHFYNLDFPDKDVDILQKCMDELELRLSDYRLASIDLHFTSGEIFLLYQELVPKLSEMLVYGSILLDFAKSSVENRDSGGLVIMETAANETVNSITSLYNGGYIGKRLIDTDDALGRKSQKLLENLGNLRRNPQLPK